MKPLLLIAIGAALVLLVQSVTSHPPESASPKSAPVVQAPALPTRAPLVERPDDCDSEPVIWEGDEIVWSPGICVDAEYEAERAAEEATFEAQWRDYNEHLAENGDPLEGADDPGYGPGGGGT